MKGITLVGIETGGEYGCCWGDTFYFKESTAFFNSNRNYGIEIEGGFRK
jgi:hypothetical protein